MFVVAYKALPKNNGHLAYKNIDLTGVKQLELNVAANPREGCIGGTIEFRLGSPTGKLIGQLQVVSVDPFAAMMSAANAVQDNGGKGGKKPAVPAKTAPAKKKPKFDMASLFNRPGVMVDIAQTNGNQDLYVVFKNAAAKPKDPIVSLSDIKLNVDKK